MAFKQIVIAYLGKHAEALSEGNALTDVNDRNAVAHAHTSALTALEYGDSALILAR